MYENCSINDIEPEYIFSKKQHILNYHLTIGYSRTENSF
jgi:hypothetical protein